jgi:hypothetical protein
MFVAVHIFLMIFNVPLGRIKVEAGEAVEIRANNYGPHLKVFYSYFKNVYGSHHSFRIIAST